MKYHDVSSQLVLIGLSLFLLSCGRDKIETSVTVSSPVLSVRPATAPQCPLGGSAIYLNNILQTLVCNKAEAVDDVFITPVQFCDGPYPENGIVIGNSVYGISGANGGSLILLPPGKHTKADKNPPCSFTVKENGDIEK